MGGKVSVWLRVTCSEMDFWIISFLIHHFFLPTSSSLESHMILFKYLVNKEKWKCDKRNRKPVNYPINLGLQPKLEKSTSEIYIAVLP